MVGTLEGGCVAGVDGGVALGQQAIDQAVDEALCVVVDGMGESGRETPSEHCTLESPGISQILLVTVSVRTAMGACAQEMER